MSELRASFGDAVDMWDHYDVLNKSHVDISNFGEYFITTVEMLLISQRKVHVQVRPPCSALALSIFHSRPRPFSCISGKEREGKGRKEGKERGKEEKGR